MLIPCPAYFSTLKRGAIRSSKSRVILGRLQGVTFQKRELFIVTASKTTNSTGVGMNCTEYKLTLETLHSHFLFWYKHHCTLVFSVPYNNN
jgi:hypothetical protein